MAVIAIGGDHLIARFQRHLHADDDRFLAYIKMAKAANESHAVKLAGFLLEAPDQQHVMIGEDLFVLVEAIPGLTGPRLLGLNLVGLLRDIGRFDRHETASL